MDENCRTVDGITLWYCTQLEKWRKEEKETWENGNTNMNVRNGETKDHIGVNHQAFKSLKWSLRNKRKRSSDWFDVQEKSRGFVFLTLWGKRFPSGLLQTHLHRAHQSLSAKLAPLLHSVCPFFWQDSLSPTLALPYHGGGEPMKAFSLMMADAGLIFRGWDLIPDRHRGVCHGAQESSKG